MNRATDGVRSEAVRLFEQFLDDLPDEDVSQFIAGRKVVTFLAFDRKVTDLAGKSVADACLALEALPLAQVKTLVKVPGVPTTKKDILNFVMLRTHGKTFDQVKADQKAAADAAKAAVLADRKAKAEAAKAANQAAKKVAADQAKAAKKIAAEKAKVEKKAATDAAKAARLAAAAVKPKIAQATTKRTSPTRKPDSAEIVSTLRRMDSASEARSWLSSVATLELLTEIAPIVGLKLESGWNKSQIVHEIVYATITGPRTLERAQS